MKIVFIGAGSQGFGRKQIIDVLKAEEFKGREVELALVDHNEQSLDVILRFSELAKKHFGTDVKLSATSNRKEALPNADYVLTAVAVNRRELWEQDYRVPRAYGFNHLYGENGGPGALFHALRSFELLIPICRDIEEFCPNAQFFNFTNPEARVMNAINRLTTVNAVGFCHGIFAGHHKIKQYLECEIEDLNVYSAGMNHLYAFLKVEDKKTGEDLLPTLLERVKADTETKHPLVRKFAEVFNIFGYPSDDHIGEYFSFGDTYAGPRWHLGKEFKPVQNGVVEPETPPFVLADYADGKKPLDDIALRPSGEITIPVILDIQENRGNFRAAINVLNTENYIENLPSNVVVEVPCTVDGKGIHPMKVGAIPEPLAALIRPQLTIHDLLTEAYRTRSKNLLLQALVLDPCTRSITNAEAMLDEMLELQKEYIPAFE